MPDVRDRLLRIAREGIALDSAVRKRRNERAA
jgi:hypothetical protein